MYTQESQIPTDGGAGDNDDYRKFENNVKPKLVYNANDKSDEPSKNEMIELFKSRKYIVQVFNQEEMDIIACAFKSKLQDIRKAIKSTEILMKKNKFEMKKEILDQYKNGLKKDLREKSLRFISII